MLTLIAVIVPPLFISLSVSTWLSIVLYKYFKSGEYKDDIVIEWDNSKVSFFDSRFNDHFDNA